MHPDFEKLVTFFTTKNVDFKKVNNCNHMVSLSDPDSNKYISSNSENYRRFAFTNMVRVYPANLFNSSNYDPLVHWSVGAQMVSLNFQTSDIHLLLNQAHFALNGKCGWVLKPDYLRQKESACPAEQSSLRITILSADLNCDPFIKKNGQMFKIFVYPYAPNKKFGPGSTAEVGSFKPIWLEHINVPPAPPELLFLQFQVRSGDNLLAQYTVSNRAMTRGFSCIQLETENGEKIPGAKLFVMIKE